MNARELQIVDAGRGPFLCWTWSLILKLRHVYFVLHNKKENRKIEKVQGSHSAKHLCLFVLQFPVPKL
jgi:hypothetical protein